MSLVTTSISHLQFSDNCIDVMDDKGDAIQPDDSVSQVSSSSSSSVNRRKMELARQTAELKAQLAVSKQMQAIELEEIQIKQKRSELENKVKLAALTEEAKLLTTTEDLVTGTNTPPVIVEDKQNCVDTEVYLNANLNASAAEFIPSSVPVMNSTTNTEATVAMNASDNTTINDSSTNQALINAIRLPVTQLVTFDGDPLKFWTFIRAFEHSLENCTNDNAARLTRLLINVLHPQGQKGHRVLLCDES